MERKLGRPTGRGPILTRCSNCSFLEEEFVAAQRTVDTLSDAIVDAIDLAEQLTRKHQQSPDSVTMLAALERMKWLVDQILPVGPLSEE